MLRYLPIILLFLALGCSKQPTIDYDPDFSTTSLKTYTIINRTEKGGDSLNDERIYKSIINEMNMKGYKYTSNDSTDFHITFEIAIKEDVPSNVSFGFGFGTYSGNTGTSVGTSRNLSSDQGNLLIRMIDPTTKKTFWQTSYTKGIEKLSSPEERSDYFKKVVSSMLKDFPSKNTNPQK